MKETQVPAKLRELQNRSGMTLAAMAKAMGYKGASSIQRYFSEADYKKNYIAPDVAEKFEQALAGKGNPPIRADEIWELTGAPRKAPKASLIGSYDPDQHEANDSEGGFTRDFWRGSVEGALPEIDAKLGAGSGQVGDIVNIPLGEQSISGHGVVAEWLLPITYLRNEAKASPASTIVMEIVGDSMIPAYQPGDRVLIDLSQNRFVSDTVYAISDGDGEPQIKRLQKVPFSDPAQVIIISDNTSLQSFTVELSRLTIIGRICGVIARR
ncbi:S24 family peptidase [Martelella sp. FLE1502]